MQQAGLRADQVSQVRGFADQRLRNAKDPLDPSNRRVSIIVQYLSNNTDEAATFTGRTGKNREKQNRPPQCEAGIRKQG